MNWPHFVKTAMAELIAGREVVFPDGRRAVPEGPVTPCSECEGEDCFACGGRGQTRRYSFREATPEEQAEAELVSQVLSWFRGELSERLTSPGTTVRAFMSRGQPTVRVVLKVEGERTRRSKSA